MTDHDRPPRLIHEVRGFRALVLRELRSALRERSDSLTVIVFFALAVTLFPLAVGPDRELLAIMAPGILWVLALLAALLSLERLFERDHADGGLDQLALAPLPLGAAVLAKVAVHWLTTGLPLALAAPLLAFTLSMPPQAYGALILSLLLGTPTLSLVGAVGAALALGARRAGILLSLLVLPLYVPVLIFAMTGVARALGGESMVPSLMILGGLLLGSL
ncbi:MAG: heme exporter protein CcmB, partial [Alphaproteobacteria bacterium]